MTPTRRPHARVVNAVYIPWQHLRRALQLAVLALFGALILATRGGTFPELQPSLFFRFDPLVWAAAVLAGRGWVEGLAAALTTIVLTLIAGRVWCGWLCPLGTVLDVVKPSRRWSRRRGQPPEEWRLIKYILLIVVLGAALGRNLTLLVLDPLSLLTRALVSFGLPGVNQALLELERALYGIDAFQPTVDEFDMAVRAPLFPAATFNAWGVVAFGLLVVVVALNWVGVRFWCRYLCPLGGMLGIVSRFAWIRRTARANACRECLRCARACPTAAINAECEYASDPAECIICLDCMPVCPVPDGQRLTLAKMPAARHAYDPSRRQALGALGLAFAGAMLYPLAPLAAQRNPSLIRPPGAQQPSFASACIRCSACVKVCPTGGLQPALWEAGLDSIWTPTLIPRLGYCDYACNACGRICPTSAIPLLALDLKRATVIGKAEIDRERCLPWSGNTPCIVCEEMCPLSPKAVTLETAEVTGTDGQPLTLQRPSVVRERCIGCGICEFKCPAEGVAAIRVAGH